MFDNIGNDDLIMAFFPCTRFEDQIILSLRGDAYQQMNHTDIQKLDYAMKIHKELDANYQTVSMLASLVLKKGLQMILENPYSEQHYLKRYWCLKPALIDKDRSKRGDYYRKPTQYFFINREPQHNFLLEPMVSNKKRAVKWTMKKATGLDRTTARSMIAPEYANRFIREFVLEEDTK